MFVDQSLRKSIQRQKQFELLSQQIETERRLITEQLNQLGYNSHGKKFKAQTKSPKRFNQNSTNVYEKIENCTKNISRPGSGSFSSSSSSTSLSIQPSTPPQSIKLNKKLGSNKQTEETHHYHSITQLDEEANDYYNKNRNQSDVEYKNQDDVTNIELDDLTSLPSITLTNDEYFKWIKSSQNKEQSTEDLLTRSDTITTIVNSNNVTTMTPIVDLVAEFDNEYYDRISKLKNLPFMGKLNGLKKDINLYNSKPTARISISLSNNSKNYELDEEMNTESLINHSIIDIHQIEAEDEQEEKEEAYLIKNFRDHYLNQSHNYNKDELINNRTEDLTATTSSTTNINIYIINDKLNSLVSVSPNSSVTSLHTSGAIALTNNSINSKNKMVDSTTESQINSSSNQASNTPATTGPAATTSQSEQNPRKDHYSYSYTYKTADPESGIPGLSSVEVNESVTEEIGPDGSKIIRRHQQEKQINKITQVVTQRVIKRQYIDPNTGQIIEYDPNNELFANLPPETVFEEHTVISDDNGNPPIVTTTTSSKTNPGQPAIQQQQKWSPSNLSKTAAQLVDQFNTMNMADQTDNINSYGNNKAINQQQLAQAATASFRIKSHPEDNQGYPEERNMDYDPDDCIYPDDDSPYEGLIQPPSNNGEGGSIHKKMSNGYEEDTFELHQHLKHHHHHHHHHHNNQSQQQHPKRRQQQHINASDGSGQSTSGSSSSPILFDQQSNGGIDMPLISNQYQKTSHYQSVNKRLPSNLVMDNGGGGNNSAYATILPSANIQGGSSCGGTTPRQQYYSTTMSSKYSQPQQNNYDLAIDPYGMQQQSQQRTFIQKQQIHHHQQVSPCINDYESSGVVVGGWRNPTLPEVIEYLTHSSNEIKANAAAYLQHLCYQDDHTKQETRLLGGISKLVNLLNSDILDVYRNACGALRNLSYGKTNDENKLDIRDKGGIPALIRLLKRTPDEGVKETITAVLWNLSSCEEIKEPILYEGLNALVKYIIVPYSSVDVLNNSNNHQRSSTLSSSKQLNQNNDYSNYPTVLTNASGVLRNCSSNLQFSNCYEARKKLRECDGLIEALMHIIDQAVEPYLSDNPQLRQQQYGGQQMVNLDLVIKDNMNSKCVENCMCILRNLSFRLQEIVDPNYDRDVKPIPTEEKTTKCVGGKKKKNFEEEFLQSVYPYNMPVPNDGKAQELLWSLSTLNKYLIIIKESTVRDTIEAAVGCLQNLTACYWRPSVIIRQEIRKLKGLPTLVHLLKSDEFEDEPIVSVTAIALRNLAIDAKNKELIGKYAMKDLVAKLPDPQRPIPMRLSVLNEDTITAALACINECIKSSGEFVKSCYNEGGVKRMVFITRNGQHFPIKIVKYAAHVLTTMWKHKNLHELLKRDGYKETDFTSVAKQMGLKSQSSSPANTLHRPRGDVNVKPSHHAPSQKKIAKGSKANTSNSASSKSKSTNGQQQQQQQMALNEMPIYSQVQKPTTPTTNNKNNNRNLIITNGGTTNADSWV